MIVLGLRDGREVVVSPEATIPFIDVEGNEVAFPVTDIERVMIRNALFGGAAGTMTDRDPDTGAPIEVGFRVLRAIDPVTKIEFHTYYPEDSAPRLGAIVEGRELEVASVVPPGNGIPK